jgi:hypothetical protein
MSKHKSISGNILKPMNKKIENAFNTEKIRILECISKMKLI